MKRKLASIQTVSNLRPILGADRIQCATILGWDVVVKKDEFKINDQCVFFEIDAILPEKPWAEFMRPRNFRIKTAKLRGQLSQGLALPLSILPKGSYEVGLDVAELLGVTKYEQPLPGPLQASSFPNFIPKTDEIRLQSIPEILSEIAGKKLVATVKLDGQSGTFAKFNNELIVCSRNWALKPGSGNQWEVALKYQLSERLPEGFAIQGEVCGPGIQKNRLELKHLDLFVFNVFDIGAQKFLNFDDACKFCTERGFKQVPVADYIGESEIYRLTLNEFLKLAEGKYEGTNNRREGIVVRPISESQSSVTKGRMSFKVISNSFLLKDED